MIKICCITYKYLDDMVRQAIAGIDQKEAEFSIVEGLRGEILDGVQNEISKGAEILLGGGANAAIAEQHFNIPILYYKISDFDYLTAIHNGLEIGKSVALVTYQTGISEKLSRYLESQRLPVQNLIYEDTQELEAEIVRSGADVIIGASHAIEIGRSCQVKTILIYPGVESIIETIRDGIVMAQEIRKVKEQNQYANTILRYTSNGVFLIDGKQQIVDCNEAAKQLLGADSRTLRNKPMSTVISNWCDEAFLKDKNKEQTYIIQINGQEILEKVIKTGANPRRFQGAVVILIKLNEVKKAQLEHEKRERESRKARGFEARKSFADIIGNSYAIKSCIGDAGVYARSDASVLIYGETGVGKELFAQGIHNESRRVDGPFIAVNCGALTENLLEAELFGYDEGAFTGSRKGGKKGLFELAEGGTIFLDEIGEISPFMQTKLLRVLQEREIMRVGGERIIAVNVRVIAATNRKLAELPGESFRRDLLYRLSVLELRIPPLRERDQDAEFLFRHFYRNRIDTRLLDVEIPEAVTGYITMHSWPGNIREMQNVCERFCLFLEQAVKVNPDVLAKCMVKAIGEEIITRGILSRYQYQGGRIERAMILELKHTLFYSYDRIAGILGTSRTTIWRLIKQEQDNVSNEG